MSLNWQNRYHPRREPERTLRRLTPGDLPAAVALCASVGWPQQEPDWERLLHWSPDGCFVVDEAGRGVIATATTTPYKTHLAWIGMVIVAPDRQRQGIGKQIMRATLDYLIARGTERIMLDASEAGRPLYREMGFREVGKIERWEGRASTYLGPRARRLKPGDTAQVLALDDMLFGIPRKHILLRLLGDFPDLAWVDFEHGELTGFLLGQRTQHGVNLGPWMSWTTASAQRLLLVAMEQLQGMKLTLNIPDNNGRSLILTSNHNLKRVRHCARMIYGDAQPIRGEPLAELAIASLATG